MFCFFRLQDGPFMWTKTAQGHVLGAFFYGYLMSQVPAGMLAEHIGGKWVFTGIMALTAIPTLLTPPAANISYKMLIVLRVLVGIGSVGVGVYVGVSVNVGVDFGVGGGVGVKENVQRFSLDNFMIRN